MNKALVDCEPLLGMRNFGMKLQTVDMPRFVCHTGNGCTISTRHQFKSRRQFGDPIAVRHPHIEHAVAFVGRIVLNILQQFGVSSGAYTRITEFGLTDVLDLPTELLRHRLHTVANSQNWQI